MFRVCARQNTLMNKVGEGIKGILCRVGTDMIFRRDLSADLTREEVGKNREEVVQRLKGDLRGGERRHRRV